MAKTKLFMGCAAILDRYRTGTGQQNSVTRLQLRPTDVALEHRELVSQYQQFGVLGRVVQESQSRQL